MANDLIALIRNKQAEIAKLQAELDEARSLLAGRLPSGAGSRLPIARPIKDRRERRGRPVGKVGPEPTRGLEVLPEGSVAYWAAKAILEAGGPLHVKDIIRKLEHQGHKVKFVTLVGSLSRWVQRRVFYRSGPNVFGLLEMRESK